MKRCEACGAFFDTEDCPNDHSHIESYLPHEFRQIPVPPRPELENQVGWWTTYLLDGEEYPAMIIQTSPVRLAVFGPGENGHVGVYTLGDHDER